MNHREFATRITDHFLEGEIIRKGLWHDGPALIRECQDLRAFGSLSLRKLAAAVKRSPTYLSRIMHRKVIMAPTTFVDMSNWLAAREDGD